MLEQHSQHPWKPRSTRPASLIEQTVEIESAGRPIRIMLVDDDPEDQNIVMTELLGAGCENFVDYLSSGKDAIRALRRPAILPDIVLLETYLHDIRGRDVLQWIKRRHPEIDVIGLSNYAEPSFLQKLYDDGLACFMRKPFTLQGLLLALGSLPTHKYGLTLTRFGE